MTTFADNGNRANGGIGGNYDTGTGRSGMAVVSNQFRGASSSPPLAMSLVKSSVAAFGADQAAHITIQSRGSFDRVGVWVRADAASASGYVLLTDGNNANSNRVYRFASGTLTVCPGSTVNITAANADVLTLASIGTTLGWFRNGVLGQSFTDTLFASGQPGLGYQWDNSGATRGDDFYAEDFASGPSLAAVDYYRRQLGGFME